jgi:hypothetical protein
MIKNLPLAPLPEHISHTLGDFFCEPESDACYVFALDPLYILTDTGAIDPAAYFCNTFDLDWSLESLRKKVGDVTSGRKLWDLIPNLKDVQARKGEVLICKRVAKKAIPLDCLFSLKDSFLPFSDVLALLCCVRPNAGSSAKIPLSTTSEACFPVMVDGKVIFIRITFVNTAIDGRWTILSGESITSISPGKVVLLQG